MFLRSTVVKSGGKALRYWKLVENYASERGTRQRVVAHLGRLEDFVAADWQRLAERLGQPDMAAALKYRVDNPGRGRPGRRSAPLNPEEGEQATPVFLSSIGWKDPRTFGDVYAVLRAWRGLGLGALLSEHIRGRSAEIVCQMAALMVANRVVAPDSELGMLDWLTGTAAPELLGLARNRVDQNRLYRCLDAVLPLKPVIEGHLVDAGRTLFGREYTAFLYDLTSTYFEGQATRVARACRGYSRDKRPDAKQICIGVVVDWEGFPVGYEIYDGNVRDAATVRGALSKLDARFGDGRPTVCMDRGMVTEETRALLRAGYRYIVAERRAEVLSRMPHVDHGAWQVVRRSPDGTPTIEVQELPSEDGERMIVVRSSGCQRKEHGIHERVTARLSQDMTALAKRVREGRLKDTAKIDRAIGRIIERHPGVSRRLQVTVISAGDRPQVDWHLRLDDVEQTSEAEGVYILRTNLTDPEPAGIWTGYMTLARVEDVFRRLKQELQLRPIFHQKQRRVEAHILLCYLAYVLLWTIERAHRSRGGTLTGRRVLEILSGIKLGTLTLRAADGRPLEIVRTSSPRPEEAAVLRTLGLRLPTPRTRDAVMDWQIPLIDNGDKTWPPQDDSEIK